MDQEPDVPEVRPPTIEDVRRLCRALAEADARYVLIGGFAVILHGGERTTKDIDLLVDPAPDNVARLKMLSRCSMTTRRGTLRPRIWRRTRSCGWPMR